jgi:hypothetical protein
MINESERTRNEVVVTNFRRYHGICLEGRGKTTKSPTQGSPFPGGNLNLGPPDNYEAATLGLTMLCQLLWLRSIG